MLNLISQPISNRRHRDWVKLRNYIFCEFVPSGRIDIKDYQIDYVGSTRKPDVHNFHFTGVYGTRSIETSAILATSFASRDRKYAHPLEIWVDVPGLTDSRKQMTRSSIEQSGWLHIERMARPLQNEIKDQLLYWLEFDHDLIVVNALSGLKVSELLLLYPALAPRLLDEVDDLGMLVHPVKTKFDLGSDVQKVIWVATVRTDKFSIAAAEMRFGPSECVI